MYTDIIQPVNEKQEGRRRKNQTVESVEDSAVTGHEVAEIFQIAMAFYDGHKQVAELTYHARNKSRDSEKRKVDVNAYDLLGYYACGNKDENSENSSAYRAFESLFRAD